MNLVCTAANLAWAVTSAPASIAFTRALANPRQTQERILRRYVTRNAQTAFGREHRLDRVRSIADFQRNIPLRNYDEIAGYIDRVATGEPNVLTCQPVLRLMPSSGSTRPAKLIPYTAALQSEFNHAIGPWIADLFRSDPALLGGCAYWSISPAVRQESSSNPPIPIGFEEDSAYLGGFRKRIVDSIMAVPPAVRNCQDIEVFRYVTMRFLLGRRDLALISVWHPSFLELLLDAGANHWDRLVSDIGSGQLTPPGNIPADIGWRFRPDPPRAKELARVGPSDTRLIWPRLRLISAWAAAHAAGPAQCLAARFPGVRFQPKGLLATEAFITIPLARRCPLAIRSHFFEFLDEEGHPRTADELRVGREYGVVVTTAAGLWRYRLGDRVRVEGMVRQTPSLEFLGRDDQVQDLRGEKLSESFVAGVLKNILSPLSPPPTFAMLAPESAGVPRYVLFIESAFASDILADQLDDALRANPHFAYSRDLGQLRPPAVFRIAANGYRLYLQTLMHERRCIGDIKPAALADDRNWAGIFPGDYVSEGSSRRIGAPHLAHEFDNRGFLRLSQHQRGDGR